MKADPRGPGILMVGNHAPPFGGVPNHVGSLAGFLSDQGWRVHVLADVCNRKGTFRVGDYFVHSPGQLQKLRALAALPSRSGVRRVRGGPQHRWPSMAGDFARANVIRNIVRNNHLSLISAYHVLKPGLSAAWVAQDQGIPLVTTLFGEIYGRPEEHVRRRVDVEHILSTSAVRLSCSRHCADSVHQLGLELPVDVVYYGVEVDTFRPVAKPERDSVVLAYVGRMVPEMGLGDLLAALPKLLADPRIRVIIAGAKGELHAAAVAAAELEGCDRVSVLADLDAEALRGVYRDADVVIAPSTNDRACLGLAIVEAMASGLPVVACRVGGTAEVVEAGRTGTLVPPGDQEALVAAVRSYADDRALREAHGSAGRARAVKLFDVSDTNAKCAQIFSSLLPAQS